MVTQIPLNEQLEVVRSTLRCKFRVFSPIQIQQLEAVERTLTALQEFRGRMGIIHKEDADRVTDEMADELIGLLQLERA